jgi:1A family penicillin-binding protein
MAKKKAKDKKFYESLPAAAPQQEFLPELPFGEVWQSLKDHASDYQRRTSDWLSDNAPAALGALGDAGTAARKFARLALGAKARAYYAAFAVLGGIIMAAVALLVASSTYAFYASDISNPNVLLNKKNTGTTILDRNGKTLFQVYGANNRQIVDIKNVPKNMVNATLAAEDPDFYNHPGFSWRATARAAFEDVTSRSKAQGGSTITQQLVKNALLTSGKSYTRKYQEILLSTELERRYSKDDIMGMYLNEIYYGQGSYGVESAAQTYFHKSSKDLTLAESAMIAGLPLGPSRFDPTINPTDALQRRNFVLTNMRDHGFITADQEKAAEAEPLKAFAQQIDIQAPHFVFYVLDQLRQEYGDDLVEHGGITVTTTLDLSKQEIAEQAVKSQIAKLGSHNVTNAGLVSIDPTDGDIESMVGSVDYYQPQWGSVNTTLSELQPGSSFKPIAYVTAFQKGAADGWNGAHVVTDKQLVLKNGDGTNYIPQNYDGKFHGNVTLRTALDNSLNIPAIEVLQYAGITDTIAMAHNLGISPDSLDEPSRYGLSLVLGGGEVRPLDMANVYATFANKGVKVTPRSILRVSDRLGKDITKKADTTPPKQAIDPRLAYMITSILSDNKARQPEFPFNSPLRLTTDGTASGQEIPAAAKTGTTNDFRDNWTIGYTPDIATAVWVGNNDHSAMQNVDGITGAAPIWHEYMEKVLAGKTVKQFDVPTGITTAKVSLTGCLSDSSSINEVFLSEYMPTNKCAVPRTIKPAPAAPKQDANPPKDGGTGGGILPDPQPSPAPPSPPSGGGGDGTTPPGRGGGTILPPSPGPN